MYKLYVFEGTKEIMRNEELSRKNLIKELKKISKNYNEDEFIEKLVEVQYEGLFTIKRLVELEFLLEDIIRLEEE